MDTLLGKLLFSSILFLILALLIIGFSPIANGNNLIPNQLTAFGVAIIVFLFVISLIALQNRLMKFTLRQSRPLLLKIANLNLIAFLIFYQFIIAGQRIFHSMPSINALTSLVFYLTGLFIFHRTAYPYISSAARKENAATSYALTEISFLIPFTIPFLFFSIVIDLISIFPKIGIDNRAFFSEGSVADFLLAAGLMILFITATLLFFPPVIQKIWRCKPIENPELKVRLEAICQKANFRHAGMMTWTVLNHAYTAGIIGILPRFRYVMFTKRLTSDLPYESIEAILAHEIGHSYRKHLLIYPFILFGMIVMTGMFTLFFSDAIDWYFSLQDLLTPSPVWIIFYSFALLFPFALIAILYFRIVFGYFSRLFERQADLHVFVLGLAPEAMIQALDELGHLTGNTHHNPNWHHHSISDRIQFLRQARDDSSLITRHNNRVKRDLVLYFLALFLFTSLVISPFFPELAFFSLAASSSKKFSESFADNLTQNLQAKVADEYIATYKLPGNPVLLHSILLENLRHWLKGQTPEMVEFESAKDLAENKEFPSSAILMSKAWDGIDETTFTPKLFSDFSLLTEEILRQYQGPESIKLEHSYLEARSRIDFRRD